MGNIQLVIRVATEEEKFLRDARLYLTPNSNAITNFKGSLKLVVKDRIQTEPLPESPCGRLKVFVGEQHGRQDMEETIDVFQNILTRILDFISNISQGSVTLIYFFGLTDAGEFSDYVLCFLPEKKDAKVRFFTSQKDKDFLKNNVQPFLCIEYPNEFFVNFIESFSRNYAAGETFVMGLNVRERQADHFSRQYLFDKELLEQALESNEVRCWWICGSDLDRMTVWHKDYNNDELIAKLQEGEYVNAGYPIHFNEK